MSCDITIQGSITPQGCSSRVPSLTYFYHAMEIFSKVLLLKRDREDREQRMYDIFHLTFNIYIFL